MKKLVTFSAVGLDVVPWSVPEIGVNRRNPAKPVRFTKRAKKSKLHQGSASLSDWQKHVKSCAIDAMAAISIPVGPVRVHIEFFARTPKGKKHGQLWEVPLRWNDEAGEYVKTQPRSKTEPDLVNLFKGTEDAIQGACVENDVQTRMMSCAAFYGPIPGCIVTVYQIEPNDFPGVGDEIE